MINLHFKGKKPPKFEAGKVIHLRVVDVYMQAPGKWRLTVEDVTPLPGAEIGYYCRVCGIAEEAKGDGSLPDGWTERKFEEGSCYLCSECKDEQVCRICGCTNEHPCDGGCYWVEEDLCSACDTKAKQRDSMTIL